MMAKDIVRQRAYVAKFYKMRAQLSSVSMQLQVFCLLVNPFSRPSAASRQ